MNVCLILPPPSQNPGIHLCDAMTNGKECEKVKSYVCHDTSHLIHPPHEDRLYNIGYGHEC